MLFMTIKRMRIERKIVVASVLILVVMAILAALPFLLDKQLQAAFGALAEVAERERTYEALLDTLRTIEFTQQACLVDGRDIFARPCTTVLMTLAPLRARLHDGGHDAAERERFGMIDREIDSVLHAVRQDLAAPRSPAAAARQATRAMEALKGHIAQEIARERQERAGWLERVTRASRFSSRGAMMAALLNALVLMAVVRAAGRALRSRQAALGRRRIALRTLRGVVDAAEARSQLLHRLQSVPHLDETPPLLSAYLQERYPDVSGAFYLRRQAQDRMERHAAWGQVRWPPDLAADAGSGHAMSSHCIVLMSHGVSIGAICLETAGAGAGEDDRRYDGMARLGEQVALVLANIELRERLRLQSVVDPLTQLYNRRFLDDTFERELQCAQREATPVSIVLIDLDHFKQVNDEHGHHVGDVLLAMVGTLLRETVRGADVACRYGGEELLVILPGCRHAHALERAEEWRSRISCLALATTTGKPIGVSASIGVASYPDHGIDPAQVVGAADAALYFAKESGRNRVASAADAARVQRPVSAAMRAAEPMRM